MTGPGLLRAFAVLAAVGVALTSCESAPSDWIEIGQGRKQLCLLTGDRIAEINQRLATSGNDISSPSVLADRDLLPQGKIYRRMVSSLSDEALLRQINQKFSPSYTYEYAERLLHAGRSEKALQFAYAGLTPMASVSFRTDGNRVFYKNEYLKEYGGYPPSVCIAYSVCADQHIEAPSFLSNCKNLRK